jgi:hypothetical protein
MPRILKQWRSSRQPSQETALTYHVINLLSTLAPRLKPSSFSKAGAMLPPHLTAGKLAPALKLDPPKLTTKLGQVSKVAVSLAGKTTAESYTGHITINFTSGKLLLY